MWLRKEVYDRYFHRLQAAYDAMPREFMGVPGRNVEETGRGRVGILCIEDFYYGLLGTDQIPVSLAEWFSLCDENLATATNGAVNQNIPTPVRLILRQIHPLIRETAQAFPCRMLHNISLTAPVLSLHLLSSFLTVRLP